MPGIGIGISPVFRKNIASHSAVTPIPIGILVEDDWNSTNWANLTTSSATVTYFPDGIEIDASGTALMMTEGIYYKPIITNLENFKFESTLKLIISSINYGPSISLASKAGDTPLFYSAICGTGNINPGRLDLWFGNNYIKDEGSTMPRADGDIITLSMEKSYGSMILKMRNVTQNSVEYTVTYNFDFNYPFSFTVPKLFKLCFSAVNSSHHKITAYKYSSVDYRNIDCLFITDSKGLYFSTSYSDAWPNLLRAANPTKYTSISGAVNETLADAIDKIDELVLINPKKYYIFLGCNDIRVNNVGIANIRLLNLKTLLESAGNDVIFIQSTIEGMGGISPIDNAAYNAYAATIFDPSKIIDTSSITVPDLEPDEIHFLPATQSIMQGLVQPYI